MGDVDEVVDDVDMEVDVIGEAVVDIVAALDDGLVSGETEEFSINEECVRISK